MIKGNSFGSKHTSLQTLLAAKLHLAGGQFLLEEQTLNKAKCLVYREGYRRPTVYKRGVQNLDPR
jgi:hypothetical protein